MTVHEAGADGVGGMGVRRFSVPGMSCGHCVAAISAEVAKVTGVEAVDVDLDAKTVAVRPLPGVTLVDAELVAAIDEAGFEAAV
jgi:copper chaperone